MKKCFRTLIFCLFILGALAGCGSDDNRGGQATDLVATPTADPPSGAVLVGTGIALSSATPGAVIHYTTDGSVPTESSTIYDPNLKPQVPEEGVTIKAIAVKAGLQNSAGATFVYEKFETGVSWEVMTSITEGRVFHTVVADNNGYVYVIGGASDAGGATPVSTNYRYNTATDTWDTMEPLPVNLSQISGAYINGKIYIPGDASTGNTYVYNISANTWSTIEAGNGYTARTFYQSVAVGGNLYVIGGNKNSAATNEVWILDTTAQTWSSGTPMQNPRINFAVAAVNGRIYVAGGVNFPDFTPDMTAEMFDGTNWSYIAGGVPNGGGAYTRWSYGACGQYQNYLWIAGGRRDAGWAVLNHTGYYNTATDTWATSPDLPFLNQERVYTAGVVATDGYFYVLGGRNSGGDIVYNNNERLRVGPAF